MRRDFNKDQAIKETQCMYLADGVSKKLRCKNPAIARNSYWAWCREHGGHHDSLERLVGQDWKPIGESEP